MLFSNADGGRDEAALEDVLEYGLRKKSGMPEDAADFTLPLSSAKSKESHF